MVCMKSKTIKWIMERRDKRKKQKTKQKWTVSTAAQMTENDLTLTFSITLDTGYLVLWPATHKEWKRKASFYFKACPVLRSGSEWAHTSFFAAVDPEVDSTTQQEQQDEEAAGDSSRDAGDGRSTQATTYQRQVQPLSRLDLFNLLGYAIWRTWTDSQDLRGLSLCSKGFRYHPEPIRGVGVEIKDVCTASAARLLVDAVKSVWGASVLDARVVLAQEAWSFHLDVKAFEKRNMGVSRHCLLKKSHICLMLSFSSSVFAQNTVGVFTHSTVFTPISSLLSLFSPGCLPTRLSLRRTNFKPENWVRDL